MCVISSAGVQEFCEDMNLEAGDPLNAFASWKKHVFGHDLECFDYNYEAFVERLSETDVGSRSNVYGSRQWYYLLCTQLGMFPITDDAGWLPDRLEPAFHIQKCQDLFGENYNNAELTPALVHLTSQFGALQQRITNIVYTNGAIDPWLHNGMLYTQEYNATVINIARKSLINNQFQFYQKPYLKMVRRPICFTSDAGLSADLGSISSLDSESVQEAKHFIQEFVIERSNTED